MRLSAREWRLLWLTLTAALAAATWAVADGRLRAWRELGDRRRALEQRRGIAERYLRREPELQRELEALRQALPRYADKEPVASELLGRIGAMETGSGLRLLSKDPRPERVVEDLCETTIQCQWEGDLDSLVKFLYAVLSQGAMMDVRQLTVQRADEKTDRLRGALTLGYAYVRGADGAAPDRPAGLEAAP